MLTNKSCSHGAASPCCVRRLGTARHGTFVAIRVIRVIRGLIWKKSVVARRNDPHVRTANPSFGGRDACAPQSDKFASIRVIRG